MKSNRCFFQSRSRRQERSGGGGVTTRDWLHAKAPGSPQGGIDATHDLPALLVYGDSLPRRMPILSARSQEADEESWDTI